MKTSCLSLLRKVALLLLTLAAALSAQAQDEAVLEKYTLGVGQNSDGLAVALTDKYFGNGTARATLSFFDTDRSNDPTEDAGHLVLFVSRFVPRDTITFALLCFGIEVRGYDAEGTKVYSKDLRGFTFGDSKSGQYSKSVRDIPLSVARLEVTFLGNYE